MKNERNRRDKWKDQGDGWPGIPVFLILMVIASCAGIYFVRKYIDTSPPVASCPPGSTAYQVFVDPTGSNQEGKSDRENWQKESTGLTKNLQRCDLVTTRDIGETTSGAVAARFSMPTCDPTDPNLTAIQKYQCKRSIDGMRDSIGAELEKRLKRTSADKTSDIFGAFSADVLGGDDGIDRSKNVLLLFSDGKERLPDKDADQTFEGQKFYINLEDSNCGRDSSLESSHQGAQALLIERAVVAAKFHDQLRYIERNLALYGAIEWVTPSNPGMAGCNDRDALRGFWDGAISAWSGNRPAPHLEFGPNLTWRNR